MKFEPKKIVIHHSATKDSSTVSWGAIWEYHVRTRGWRDIGYHAGVELARGRYEAFYGRPITKRGAHTAGHNSDSLGLCFVGDFDVEEPPKEQLMVGIRRVLIPWLFQFNLAVADIYGHRDFADKSCPGERFDMTYFRDLVLVSMGRVV